MKKVYVSWTDVEHQVQELLRQMQQDAWQPDYVVGITRGGLVPANNNQAVVVATQTRTRI